MPVETFVDATDLNAWANRREAQSLLPRLVQATSDRVERIGFPADEGVHLAGYDGIVRVDEASSFTPAGTSVWELGTNRGVKGKADEDYEKRCADPLGLDPSETAFVFVTPRRWGGKEDWVDGGEQERRLAETYREYASATSDRWPRTSALLRRIAEGYASEAQHEDREAELREDLWG